MKRERQPPRFVQMRSALFDQLVRFASGFGTDGPALSALLSLIKAEDPHGCEHQQAERLCRVRGRLAQRRQAADFVARYRGQLVWLVDAGHPKRPRVVAPFAVMGRRGLNVLGRVCGPKRDLLTNQTLGWTYPTGTMLANPCNLADPQIVTSITIQRATIV